MNINNSQHGKELNIFKCNLWNCCCVLPCHAFHRLSGFLVGLAYLQTEFICSFLWQLDVC